MTQDNSDEFLLCRHATPVAVVARPGSLASQIRHALKEVGFVSITCLASHAQTLERMNSSRFPLVLFELKSKDISPLEFVKEAVKIDPKVTLLIITSQPQIDDVFCYIKEGARGFLITPFTTHSLEESLYRASKGIHLSPVIRDATDRNGALAVVMLNNLYRLSLVMQNARKYPSAQRDVDRYRYQFLESVDLSHLFCEGADRSVLLDKVVEECISRAETVRTRLGATRRELKKERDKKKDVKELDNDNPLSSHYQAEE